MKYEYRCEETGETGYRELSPRKAPPVGHEIEFPDGRVFVRVFSVPEAAVPQAFTARSGGIKSHQLPRHWKHHKGEFDAVGKPLFRSRAEAQDACKRANDNGAPGLEYGKL